MDKRWTTQDSLRASGIALTAMGFGLILALAVRKTAVGGLDISTTGWIIAAMGLVGLLVSIALTRPRRMGGVTTRTVDPVTGGEVVERSNLA